MRRGLWLVCVLLLLPFFSWAMSQESLVEELLSIELELMSWNERSRMLSETLLERESELSLLTSRLAGSLEISRLLKLELKELKTELSRSRANSESLSNLASRLRLELEQTQTSHDGLLTALSNQSSAFELYESESKLLLRRWKLVTLAAVVFGALMLVIAL